MTTFCIVFYESYLPQLSCQTESRKTKREEREVTGMAKIADGGVSLKPILTTAKNVEFFTFSRSNEVKERKPFNRHWSNSGHN
jgi:hypothetical protein